MGVDGIHGKHVEPSTLKKQHARTFKTIAEEAKKNDDNLSGPCALHPPAYVSDSLGSIRLQRLDVGTDRGTLIDSDEQPLCSPFRRFGPGCDGQYSPEDRRNEATACSSAEKNVAETVAGTGLDGLGWRDVAFRLVHYCLQALTWRYHPILDGPRFLLSRGSGVRISPGAPEPILHQMRLTP
jgi:hypothetical protein